MDDTAKTISEFLLERLKESAALEAAEGAEPPPGVPADPLGAVLPELRREAEPRPDRNGARRGYAQTAREDSRPLGSG